MVNESKSEPHRRRIVGTGVGMILLACAVVVIMTFVQRNRVAKESRRLKAHQAQGSKVSVSRVLKTPPVREIELIGDARPFLSTSLFARVSGYISKIYVDRGDEVKQGEVLAEIESPEADRSYLAALADAENKQRIADRNIILWRRRLISQQEKDEAVAIARIAQAVLGTQKVLKSYKYLLAPFSGTITGRYVDPGALVQNATNSESSSQVLFDLSQTERLRIFGYVDQKNAAFIRPGLDAEIQSQNSLQKTAAISAKVTRTAGALDPKTRTLLTEIDIDNRDQRVVAGSFIRLVLRIPNPPTLEVPIKALVTRGDQSFVPVVRPDRTLHYQSVTTAGSDGESVQILSGLKEGETVAVGASIFAEGSKVQIQEAGNQG